jgi:hypothetical protein
MHKSAVQKTLHAWNINVCPTCVALCVLRDPNVCCRSSMSDCFGMQALLPAATKLGTSAALLLLLLLLTPSKVRPAQPDSVLDGLLSCAVLIDRDMAFKVVEDISS